MNNKTLHLTLYKKWFDMTKEGVKTEDYRSFDAKNCCKYLTCMGEKMSTKKWQELFFDRKPNDLNFMLANLQCKSIGFHLNKMTLGYPKKNDPERTILLEHKGIEIRTGNIEWGAEPNKLYFVIKHGKILEL